MIPACFLKSYYIRYSKKLENLKTYVLSAYINFFFSNVSQIEFNPKQLTQIKGKMPGIYRTDVKYIMATVSLRDENNTHLCLGTAFRPRRILTTSTCVEPKLNEDNFGGMYVWVGGNFHSEDGIKLSIQTIKCSSYHENRTVNEDMQYNIAIVTVSIV